MSGEGDVGCAGVIAGKPAPTGLLGVAGICVWWGSPCRSWLASEGGLSGEGDVGCAGVIAGKPAPTGLLGVAGICVWW
ncbi:hypothetical protein EMIT0P218_30425 [Pseudomonas sp. IT-P218]